jgi:oxygen-independent coproporphyrinogen-3 oxidase
VFFNHLCPFMAGIYIHIPFCRKACTYCNFHFSTSLSQKEDMLAAIAWELENQREYLQGERIETIYLGGGTPSLLSAEELQHIFGVIEKFYDLGSLKECTLEANPDDLQADYVKSLKQTPVSRFSIGVQSFFDSDLLYMNRAHNAQQADYAIKAAQDAGFENLTIDLIYGTPGLSNMAWLENLAKTESLGIPHFSAYALTVEEGTALHHAIQHKKQTPVDQEQSAAQLELLMEYAPKMGFEQYEISNFAAGQRYALHNTNYWKGIPYLGIGPSAHSFDGYNRRSNVANNSRYLKSMLQERKTDFETEILTEHQRLNEYIMTSLRTVWGCDLQHVERTWGAAGQLKKASQIFVEKKWLALDKDVLLLTDAGKLFADHIASELFVL